MRKIILKTLIIAFIVSALLGISIVLFDLWNDVTGKILLSTVTIFGFSIPGLACSANYEKTKNKTVSTIGMITCFVSGIYFLLLIWELLNFNFLNSIMWKFSVTCIILSASFGHICLLLLIDSGNKKVNYLKNSTILISIILDLLLLFEIYSEIKLSWKVIIILAILIVLGTIVTPLSNKLNSKTKIPQENSDEKYVNLEQLKRLLDNNAITKEEYDNEKNKILNNNK